MTPDDRKREERTSCGLQAHEDAIAERDELRAVLKDLLEERGYEAKLMLARAQLKAALWLLEHRATEMVGFDTETLPGEPAPDADVESQRQLMGRDWAQTVKLLKLALTTLPPTPGHDSTEAETRKLALPGHVDFPTNIPVPTAWQPGAPPGHYTITPAQMTQLTGALVGAIAAASGVAARGAGRRSVGGRCKVCDTFPCDCDPRPF